MKHLKFLFLIILIITLNSTAFALNLEVDSDLNDFADKNVLSESQTQNLKNPFFIEKELGENSEEQEAEEKEDSELKEEVEKEEVETETEPNISANRVEEREENIIEREPEPEIIINGIISASNSRIALLISYRQEKHLLQIGESIDGYKLTAYKNGEATFIKKGREIKVAY